MDQSSPDFFRRTQEESLSITYLSDFHSQIVGLTLPVCLFVLLSSAFTSSCNFANSSEYRCASVQFVNGLSVNMKFIIEMILLTETKSRNMLRYLHLMKQKYYLTLVVEFSILQSIKMFYSLKKFEYKINCDSEYQYYYYCCCYCQR